MARQLSAAACAGLTVADTLVTNTADAAVSFAVEYEDTAGLVRKMFAANSIVEHVRR